VCEVIRVSSSTLQILMYVGREVGPFSIHKWCDQCPSIRM